MGEDNVKLSGIQFIKDTSGFRDEFPDKYEEDGVVYDIIGFTDDGHLRLRDPSGSSEVTLDTSRDVNDVIREGLENGIFSGKASVKDNPNGTVLRAEFIFELWRALSREEGSGISDSVGQDAYYKHAVTWIENNGLGDLYSARDYEGAITWMELHHIIFNVLTTTRYRSVGGAKNMNISVITTEMANGSRKPELRMSEYKQTRWMKVYLDEIRKNRRCVPLPGYLAFQEGRKQGIVPSNEGIRLTASGDLGAPLLDVSSDEWILAEVRRQDLSTLLPQITALVKQNS